MISRPVYSGAPLYGENQTLAAAKGKLVLALAVLLGLLAVLYGAFQYGIEPFWLLVVCATITVGLVIGRKWPLAPIAGLLFVGAFKSVPAQGISLTDPTMMVLLIALAAIFVELLFVVSGSSPLSLQELFAGQALGMFLFLAFASVVSLSYLYSPAHESGWIKLLHFVVFQTVVFFAPLILVRKEKDLEQLLIAFFLLGLALSLKEIYGFLHPTQDILSGDKDITNIGSAQLIGMTLLIFFYAQPFRRFPKVLAVPVLGIGLVACAARGPLLSMLVVMVVYSFAVRKSSGFVSYKQIIAGLAIVALVVAGAISWIEKYPAARDKVEQKQRELAAFAEGSANPGGTIEERIEFYRSALRAFQKEPLIGLGLDGWAVYYYGSDKIGYPHNIVLEVAAEQGIVGLTALFAFLAAVWLGSRRIWKQNPGYAFAIPLFVYSFLVCMFSGDINVRALWLWSGTIFAISRMCCFQKANGIPLAQAGPGQILSALQAASGLQRGDAL